MVVASFHATGPQQHADTMREETVRYVAEQHPEDFVDAFPEGNDFLDQMTLAGYTDVKAQRLTGGIATIYTGRKA